MKGEWADCEDSCPVQCTTIGGPKSGQSCVFPFRYNKKPKNAEWIWLKHRRKKVFKFCLWCLKTKFHSAQKHVCYEHHDIYSRNVFRASFSSIRGGSRGHQIFLNRKTFLAQEGGVTQSKFSLAEKTGFPHFFYGILSYLGLFCHFKKEANGSTWPKISLFSVTRRSRSDYHSGHWVIVSRLDWCDVVPIEDLTDVTL